jgi:hypothetical protein
LFRRRASLVTFAALLAALGAPARAQDSEEDLLPRAPFTDVGDDSASEAAAQAAAQIVDPAPDPAAEAASPSGGQPVRFPRAPEPLPPPVQDARPQEKPAPPLPEDEQNRRLRTWEMPALEVVGSGLKEEELIGSNQQPRWTTERLFPTTRVYVLPEGTIHGEYWMRIQNPREGDTRVRDYYELEFGLPNRFQLDLYLVSDHTGANVPGDITTEMIEGRYAFADWGEIWGNPTVYLEYIHQDSPDGLEGKLLLGSEVSPGWHWASNLACEQQTAGERERELQLTGGLSHTIIDDKFSMGVEGKLQQTDTEDDPGDDEDVFEIGPTMRWQPSERSYIDFAPLIGFGGESPQAEIFLIMGWEF